MKRKGKEKKVERRDRGIGSEGEGREGKKWNWFQLKH